MLRSVLRARSDDGTVPVRSRHLRLVRRWRPSRPVQEREHRLPLLAMPSRLCTDRPRDQADLHRLRPVAQQDDGGMLWEAGRRRAHSMCGGLLRVRREHHRRHSSGVRSDVILRESREKEEREQRKKFALDIVCCYL